MAKINVIEDPPFLPFFFGKYNRRTLEKRQAKRLASSFDSDAVRGFEPEKMLPIFLPSADCVELDGLIKDVSATQNMSMLTLTEKGRSLTHLVFGSGQHRVAAARMMASIVKNRIEKIMSDIQKLQS